MPEPPRITRALLGAAALALTLLGAGCAGGGEMTPQQREGVELRRYCETHPEDLVKCLGFLGDH